MASLKLVVRPFVLALLHAIFLFSSSVLSDGDVAGMVLAGLNSHRTFLGLPSFTDNENADCLAGKIALNVLMDQQCDTTSDNSVELDKYPDLLSDCGIYINQTKDGVILPVCVATLVPTLVLTNYTYTHFANYINDWRFTGAGIGSGGDWMVVVLSTNTPEGSFGLFTKDDEEDLFKSLNSHRAYLDLPSFIKNKEAGCVAGEVARKLGKKPCEEGATDEMNGSSDNPYPELLAKCDINITSKRDAVVLLPVCVPKLILTDVFTNYTRTRYSVYINDFKFVEAGLRCNGDWMVLVLSTNATLTERLGGDASVGGDGSGGGDGGGDGGGGGGGYFVGANNSSGFRVGFGHCWVACFLLWMLVFC